MRPRTTLPKEPVTPPSLHEVIDQMPDAFLACRTWMHAWEPYTTRRGKYGERDEVTRCARCKLKRAQTIDRRGYIVPNSNRYDYTEVPGYLLPAGIGNDADTRAAVRLARVERTEAHAVDAKPRRRGNLRAV